MSVLHTDRLPCWSCKTSVLIGQTHPYGPKSWDEVEVKTHWRPVWKCIESNGVCPKFELGSRLLTHSNTHTHHTQLLCLFTFSSPLFAVSPCSKTAQTGRGLRRQTREQERQTDTERGRKGLSTSCLHARVYSACAHSACCGVGCRKILCVVCCASPQGAPLLFQSWICVTPGYFFW